MAKYYELDIIDPLLTEEEIIIRDSVRGFSNLEIIPVIGEYFADGEFPKDLIPGLASLGVFGANLDLEKYVSGFVKISHTAYGLMMQELERADSGIRSFASAQGALVMFLILEYGSEEQKRYWLSKLYRGEAIGCFGLTEEHGGSDPSSMKTYATDIKRNSVRGYEIKGKKVWITNGEIADVAVVFARYQGDIRAFLVPKETENFETAPMVAKKYKNSMRASVTSELILDNCFIPEQNILPGAWHAKSFLKCLEKAQYGIDWGVIGAAYACFAEAVEHIKNPKRKVFGEPLSHKQLVHYKTAVMLELEMMQAAMLTWGRLADKGKLTHIEVSLAKFVNVSKALNIALEAERLLGANRISWEFHAPRHLANLRAVETYEGTPEIHALRQGAHITGHKAY